MGSKTGVAFIILISVYIYIYIYIYILNSLGSVRFFMFLSQFLLLIKVVSIWSKIQENNYFVKYYCNLKKFSILIYFKIEFIPVSKAEFSSSLLKSSVSHDPSEEIILIFWFIINVGNICAASYCFGTCDIIFRIRWLIKKIKEQHLF